MRSVEEFEIVQRLIAAGLNDCAIARQTGIPRCTVRDWRCRPQLRVRTAGGSPCAHDFTCLPAKSYSYLLGLYLGDGCVSRHPRAWRLRIVLDTKYPGIIEQCRQAIDTLMPGQRAATLRRPNNCTEVSLYSKHWPCLLPQHGPGRKHFRPIGLEAWQEELVGEATEEFVRGLIHSDGCRVVANDRGVRSVRYHFSNRSDDIRGLYCAALDQLGIPWTQPRWFDIAVYRKAATARLDEFVGPKA
ncbi:MAG TPA: helix-turn-helix domain-containing protein [Mycobacterium sp.]|nr:helix-turn-helix domain-containing protein [Mycobacterium sp.]